MSCACKNKYIMSQEQFHLITCMYKKLTHVLIRLNYFIEKLLIDIDLIKLMNEYMYGYVNERTICFPVHFEFLITYFLNLKKKDFEYFLTQYRILLKVFVCVST